MNVCSFHKLPFPSLPLHTSKAMRYFPTFVMAINAKGHLLSSHVDFFQMSHVGIKVGTILWCGVQAELFYI